MSLRIVVAGVTGRIGREVAAMLAADGHHVVGVSRAEGVDAITGAGLADALVGADVVVDVLRPTGAEDAGVAEFFAASTTNLLAAGAAAGVRHHVALSVVGCDRVPDSGFLHAKAEQERLIQASGRPFTIVRAAQFFEFVPHIADTLVDADLGVVRVPPATLQPIAAADASAAVARAAQHEPTNATVDVAGPEAVPMVDLVRRVLDARGDATPVVVDPEATYFGTRLDGGELLPRPGATLAEERFDDWLAASEPAASSRAAEPTERRDPDVPDGFDVVTVVLLRRPTDAPHLTEAELDDLQARHLAYRADLARRGETVANGPFLAQSDESFRGMSIFACGPEEAARLSAADPSVLAGRLAFDVMEWWTAAGSLDFPRVDGPVGERRSLPDD